MSSLESAGIVEDVYILGAPVSANPAQYLPLLDDVVCGKLVIGYSRLVTPPMVSYAVRHQRNTEMPVRFVMNSCEIRDGFPVRFVMDFLKGL